MSYSNVEKQIHSVPEEYMDEVADFLDYLMYKIKRKEDKQHTSSFFWKHYQTDRWVKCSKEHERLIDKLLQNASL